MGIYSRNTGAATAADGITQLARDDWGDNVGRAFCVVVIQHHGLSSEIYFLEDGNKKGSCVVGKKKMKTMSSRSPVTVES